ncbi:hypothetical protein [Terrisporobacter sp.]|uniref:hypothetical protein n=1 Tax=Terrisporobacter sp. TaxID=1965305 RepID=UPI003996355D
MKVKVLKSFVILNNENQLESYKMHKVYDLKDSDAKSYLKQGLVCEIKQEKKQKVEKPAEEKPKATRKKKTEEK